MLLPNDKTAKLESHDRHIAIRLHELTEANYLRETQLNTVISKPTNEIHYLRDKLSSVLEFQVDDSETTGRSLFKCLGTKQVKG